MNIEQFTKAMIYYQSLLPASAPEFGNPLVLKFWYDQLSPYGPAKLRTAFDALVLKVDRFPSMRIVLKEIDGRADPHAEGIDISANISAAISRYGYCNPIEAKKFLGELGWHIVSLAGGWDHICSTVTNKDLSIYQAQWRELAKVQVDKRNSGQLSLLEHQKRDIEVIDNDKDSCLQKALKIIEDGPKKRI